MYNYNYKMESINDYHDSNNSSLYNSNIEYATKNPEYEDFVYCASTQPKRVERNPYANYNPLIEAYERRKKQEEIEEENAIERAEIEKKIREQEEEEERERMAKEEMEKLQKRLKTNFTLSEYEFKLVYSEDE